MGQAARLAAGEGRNAGGVAEWVDGCACNTEGCRGGPGVRRRCKACSFDAAFFVKDVREGWSARHAPYCPIREPWDTWVKEQPALRSS